MVGRRGALQRGMVRGERSSAAMLRSSPGTSAGDVGDAVVSACVVSPRLPLCARLKAAGGGTISLHGNFRGIRCKAGALCCVDVRSKARNKESSISFDFFSDVARRTFVVCSRPFLANRRLLVSKHGSESLRPPFRRCVVGVILLSRPLSSPTISEQRRSFLPPDAFVMRYSFPGSSKTTFSRRHLTTVTVFHRDNAYAVTSVPAEQSRFARPARIC
ncbi:hypothetical protein MRX96_035733 [Rhipicephalus microplus]